MTSLMFVNPNSPDLSVHRTCARRLESISSPVLARNGHISFGCLLCLLQVGTGVSDISLADPHPLYHRAEVLY